MSMLFTKKKKIHYAIFKYINIKINSPHLQFSYFIITSMISRSHNKMRRLKSKLSEQSREQNRLKKKRTDYVLCNINYNLYPKDYIVYTKW